MTFERTRFRYSDEIVFECDEPRCTAVIHTETDDFQSAVAVMREQGWKARRVGSLSDADWLHFCPEHDE